MKPCPRCKNQSLHWYRDDTFHGPYCNAPGCSYERIGMRR